MTSQRLLRDEWLGVELRHLATLAAIVEAGSFKGAAQQLGYVQSAVSQQVSFLEGCVGRQLIERSPGPRPVTLTEPGEVLLEHAERILARLRAAAADLEALTSGVSPVVRVGIDPSISRRILPTFLCELRAALPGLDVTPVEVECPLERAALVEGGMLAVAFVDLPAPPGPFDTIKLMADPHVLLVPADGLLAGLKRAPSLAELNGERLLGRSAERVGGIAACPVGEVPGDSTVQALVAAGHGVAILPRLAVDQSDRTVALALDDVVPARVLGLCWNRDRRVNDTVAALRLAAERSAAATADALGPAA